MPKGIMSEGWNVDTLVAAGAGISMDSPSRDFCWVMVFIFHALPPGRLPAGSGWCCGKVEAELSKGEAVPAEVVIFCALSERVLATAG